MTEKTGIIGGLDLREKQSTQDRVMWDLPVFGEVFEAEDVEDADAGATVCSLADWSIDRYVDSVDDANKHATIDTFHECIADISWCCSGQRRRHCFTAGEYRSCCQRSQNLILSDLYTIVRRDYIPSQTGLGVRVSTSFQNIPHLVGQLWSRVGVSFHIFSGSNTTLTLT